MYFDRTALLSEGSAGRSAMFDECRLPWVQHRTAAEVCPVGSGGDPPPNTWDYECPTGAQSLPCLATLETPGL